MSEELKVYTANDVAKILKLSRRAVINYLQEGKIKASKIGRFWRIQEEDLKEFLNNGCEVIDRNKRKS